MKGKVFFITGIDTNIGKTFITGIWAKQLANTGHKVITQKMVQTGCLERSEDIEEHRHLQGLPYLPEDEMGLTCPYIFTYPCSPHMAAEKDKRIIDTKLITQATNKLREKYEIVLLEGAGGLMVPIDHKQLTIDYLKECNYPVVLVTSGRLGSINHTILSLEACLCREISVYSVVYNNYPPADKAIDLNTRAYIKEYLQRKSPETLFQVFDKGFLK